MHRTRTNKDIDRMNARNYILVMASAFAIAGCASRETLAPAPRADTEHVLGLALSYENLGDLRRATEVYTSVATRYPHSDPGAEAAFKAGLLRVNPHNPARDDTLALKWFRIALARPIPLEDRRHAENYSTQLLHLQELRQDLNVQWRLNDSLRSVIRQQGVAIAGHQRRTLELEEQLSAVNAELKKLKEVDLQIARTRQHR